MAVSQILDVVKLHTHGEDETVKTETQREQVWAGGDGGTSAGLQ